MRVGGAYGCDVAEEIFLRAAMARLQTIHGSMLRVYVNRFRDSRLVSATHHHGLTQTDEMPGRIRW